MRRVWGHSGGAWHVLEGDETSAGLCGDAGPWCGATTLRPGFGLCRDCAALAANGTSVHLEVRRRAAAQETRRMAAARRLALDLRRTR